MIMGKPPFFNINEAVQMDMILKSDVDLSSFEPEVADLISKLLIKEPELRYINC